MGVAISTILAIRDEKQLYNVTDFVRISPSLDGTLDSLARVSIAALREYDAYYGLEISIQVCNDAFFADL